MPLHCYGENSATFLIFKALIAVPTGIRDLLLSLHQAGNGNPIAEDLVPDEVPEVWLFPNFGRRHGFGEPDALVLLGGQSFWFEVETSVNLGTRRMAARQSLLQLARFHFFHRALQNGDQVLPYTPHLAIMGPTVSNSGLGKHALLRIAGHPVLQAIQGRLADSIPHYVFMSIHQAQGVGGGGPPFGPDLGHLAGELFGELGHTLAAWGQEVQYPHDPGLPAMLEPANVYYTYWYGPALAHCYPNGGDPLADAWVGP